MPTKIEWVDESLNPILGCSKISDSCTNCYAEKMARRLITMPKLAERYKGTVDKNGWTGQLNFVPSELEKPARWKKPRRIFVGSMTDIFHEKVEFEWLDKILRVVSDNPRHTFIFLTKRPERMKTFIDRCDKIWWSWRGGYFENLWLGVTAENQEMFDQRVPVLLSIPAAVHFVSLEPLLSEIDTHVIYLPEEVRTELPAFISRAHAVKGIYKPARNPQGAISVETPYGMFGIKPGECRQLSWAICGSESGPGKRPMSLKWARGIRDQCKDAGIPFFFKKDSDGKVPDDLNIREFPKS